MTVTNTTISGNAAQNNGYGGGVFNEADCNYQNPTCGTTTLTLENVTLYGNSAGTESSGLSRGGGIWSNNNSSPYGGSVTTTLKNSIVAGNTNGDCRDVTNSFVRQGYDIASDNTCGVNQFTVAQLRLGVLNQSGQTWFHPLLAGSVAIDKVDTSACTVTVDQIGTFRPFGAKCDVGANEFKRPPLSDFDADGISDAGIFRPSQTPNALWYAPQSGGGVFQIYFGGSGDIPVPADYDGDGKADAAIFRPSTGLWYGPRTGGSTIVIQLNLGQNGDIPIPADYDGDTQVDPAIYRPSTGLFYG
ncbi:MAG TPA: VCBS repeat-containing protein, partial [Mycobacteriales bacterium]|nr:VCBS repeat-containing protein [Mycobacteriales bacterium]